METMVSFSWKPICHQNVLVIGWEKCVEQEKRFRQKRPGGEGEGADEKYQARKRAVGNGGGRKHRSRCFRHFWTIMAFVITQDSPFPVVGSIFPLFGVVFVIIGIAQGVYHYKNATGKERMSLYDITDASEEGDPLNRKYGGERAAGKPTRTEAAGEKRFARTADSACRPTTNTVQAAGKSVTATAFCRLCTTLASRFASCNVYFFNKVLSLVRGRFLVQ